MRVPRRAAWLAGVVLLAAASGQVWALDETVPSAPGSEFSLPEVPEAPVTFSTADLMSTAIGTRLADEKFQLNPRLSKKDREAIAAFYALGEFKPVWIKNAAWTPAARAVMDRLQKAHEHGLNPADYPIPAMAADTPDALAEADLKLSASVVLYARDARGARIEPARLSRLITPKLELPSGDVVLTSLASAKDAGAALASFNPPHAGYLALKAKLAEIRASQPGSRLEGEIVANMERWRWLPSDMGARHVWVNVPEFKLRLMDHGRLVHQARVIVGKPESPTPLFSEKMDHAIVNPSWYVPPSIFRNEFHSDPGYAAARGYQVVRTRGGGFSIRQPPGERNALGFIKFMFPNQHSVYLHDTPNRSLFGAQRRAFSHGCVRLDQPFRFAEFVLGSEWTEGRLRSLIGRGERTIKLPEKLPVHLTYFTLVVDEQGKLASVGDLYGVDSKVRVALGVPGGERTAVATAVDKPRLRQRVARAQPARPRVIIRRAQAAVAPPAPVQYPVWWWVR